MESPSDAIFWRDATSNPDSEGAAEKVAAAIRSAAAVATGGTSAPALLSYLDAEDVGVYVLNLMSRKEANNKAAFFSEMNDKIDTRTDTGTDTKPDSSTDHSTHADDVDLEACWKKLPPLVRFGKYDHECKASDPAYFESLPLWEQRWVDDSRFRTVLVPGPASSLWRFRRKPGRLRTQATPQWKRLGQDCSIGFVTVLNITC